MLRKVLCVLLLWMFLMCPLSTIASPNKVFLSKPIALSEAIMSATIGGHGSQCNIYGYCAEPCTNIIVGRKSYRVYGRYQNVDYGHYYCGPAPSGNCSNNMQMICGLRVYYADYNCQGGETGYKEYKWDLGCLRGP
jgi:hypothetical protein